jgi:hypothetical protein
MCGIIVVFIVVEVVTNDDGSNKNVSNTLLHGFVRATEGQFVQGEQNWVGFFGTSKDTCNGYMVLTLSMYAGVYTVQNRMDVVCMYVWKQ